MQIEAARPGLRSWAMMVGTEGKLVARDTAGLIVPLGLPMLIMVMNGLGADGEGVPAFNGLPPLDAYVVPLTLVMMIAVIGVVNMPSFLAAYRKTGVLRRLAVTPAHPIQVLVAQVVVSMIQAICGLIMALVLARAAFDVSMPRNILGAIGVFLLISVAMYALGMLVAAIAPTTNSAVAIGLVLFFALLALGGGFGGRDALPDALATVGEYLPYGAGVEALSATWMGVAPDALHLGVLAGTTLLAGALAAKLFRWT
ncbi:ABC-2 type transport system permease protein [Tamaricihabitans halophyticus]|uniref:ABC-2 type transport system permease protein n=1 Tax=Tamaricihabitans halophyticus TaxID=1262583 RepID=A0A4R2R571_9PSEU|nr:ABC transporter permease [Tamaricihabitans halophyticus]TCP57104.1 ABC-2 type transport system permease protein [Tamaricihabitans halophyticus]